MYCVPVVLLVKLSREYFTKSDVCVVRDLVRLASNDACMNENGMLSLVLLLRFIFLILTAH